ncbi:MAG: hypothetical protein GDA46_01005 [Bdellovibrionales bacterium]|nr:hypothetical protein [Bdellovibrionales bacterium]
MFRLIHFAVKLFVSLLFVFILQIHFDGRSLESYLTGFGKNFFLTKTLNSVGEDGVKVVRMFTSDDKVLEKKREISNKKTKDFLKNISKRIDLDSKETEKEL